VHHVAALDALDASDQALMAELLSALARALIFSGEQGPSGKVQQQAVAMARRAGDPGPATACRPLQAATSALVN
jgi:hypothetical protein